MSMPPLTPAVMERDVGHVSGTPGQGLNATTPTTATIPQLQTKEKNKIDNTTDVSFRQVPAREKMVVPEWLDAEREEGRAEVKYTLSLVNGTYQGLLQQEKATNDLIRTFETRDNDVFVCTFVKSGTTWTQHIINLLLSKGEPSEKNYTEAVPWLESLTFTGANEEAPELHREVGLAPVCDDAVKHASHRAKNWTLDTLRSTAERRFMKTHANIRDLPAGSAMGLKVIYVARNPKDVCVSLFHHARNRPKEPFVGEFSDMLACFVKGRCANGSWFNHVLEWWEAANADPEHVLFLTYEQMLADPQEHILKIAEFAGISCTEEVLAKTTAGSTLSAMKNNPKANIRPSLHLRKGGAGGWRNAFTVRESEAFDDIYRHQMKGSGLKMDFGEGLVM